MGLTANEDVSLDGFLKMLARLKRELAGSAHNQQCEPFIAPFPQALLQSLTT
jgi:hypothetical protein